MSRPGRRPARLVACAAVLGGLTACSTAIAEDALEDQVGRAIRDTAGVTSEVDCPRPVAAEVDATTECTATDPGTGDELRLRITVTSVEDGQARFDITPLR